MGNIYFDSFFEQLFEKYPVTLVDVGASGGIPPLWKKALKYLKVIGFEPDKRSFKILEKNPDRKLKYINTGLFSYDGTIKINLCKTKTNSSFFVPNKSFLNQFPDEQRFEVVGSAEINVKKLTPKLLKGEGVDDVDFMKVDVQGAEFAILLGAGELLEKQLIGVESEVEFTQVYENQPLFSDVDKYMRKKGYFLFDLKRYFWRRKTGKTMPSVKGQIVFADALYIKSYENIVKTAAGCINSDMKKAKILKALSICRLYGLNDYIMYLCERAFEDKLFTVNEITLIKKSMSSVLKVPNFKGHYKIGQLLYKLFRYFNSTDFYYVDRELGNE